MADAKSNIESLLKEQRVFKPSESFSRQAHIGSLEEYEALSKRAAVDPEGYWAGIASELHWFERWNKVLEWDLPFSKWFVGGKTNIAYNCLDRHLTTARKNKVAILWEGEPGEVRALSYQLLHREVSRFANVLKSLGLKSGDRATIYMGMVPELAIALLACSRIGVTHNVVFGGFSAEALRDRINDSKSRILITQDGGYRRGTVVPLKKNADDALKGTPTIEKVIVCQRTGGPVEMMHGRDAWWHELMDLASGICDPEILDSEHPLFMLYTSGTTGKPKGVVHTTGGYMTGTYLTTKWVFDLKDEDTYWCTADIGWVTGHSYVVYGILANGATSLMFEGVPNYPQNHRLSSLRLLGSVGEPINPEAWIWYHEVIGGGRCPIVDTWWQTETGGIMITPLPGITTTKPGSATVPFPGISAALLDQQ